MPVPALTGNPTGFCCWKSLTSLSDGRLLEGLTGCLAASEMVSKNADAKNEEEKLVFSLQRQSECVETLHQGILVQSNTVKRY